jgi:hypothetical protein
MKTSHPFRLAHARALGTLTCLLVGGLALAWPAQAQLRFLPSVGMYAPLEDLGSIRDSGGQVLVDAGKHDATLAFGLGIELLDPDGLLSLRGQLGYATSADVPIDGIGCTDCELRSTLLTATAAVVVRPVPRLAVVQPFVVVGGGIKRFDFDREDLSSDGFIDGFRDQSRPAFQLGTGLQFALGGFRPVVELSAYLSRFEVEPEGAGQTGSDERQVDLMLTVAIPLGGG